MSPDPHVIVHAPCGPVRGLVRPLAPHSPESTAPPSYAFLGIPFASPPVGDLRFRAPRRHPAWTEVRDAHRYGATPQRRPFSDAPTIPEPSYPGESILCLNVFTPAPGEAGAALPVLVWVHGGGYFAGSPSSPWYDGQAFNRDGVVTVSVSYRLGFDGYGWIEDAPNNRGVLDQICALEWVRDNISAFGGDPTRVTIAGQSAGGGSVMTLLASPLARGLFTGVISQSGATTDIPLEQAQARGRAWATAAGIPATVAGWSCLDEEQILDLTSSTEGGEDFTAALGRDGATLPLGPVVDGVVLPAPVVSCLEAGVGAEVRLLAGDNEHEFTAIGHAFAGLPAQQTLVSAGRPPEWVSAFVTAHAHLGERFGGEHMILGQALTHSFFHSAVQRWMSARESTGARDTWRYRFRLPGPDGLSSHCLEIPFVFDQLSGEHVTRALGEEPPQALADLMHGVWVSFVKGEPPAWQAWPGTRETLILDAPSSLPCRLSTELLETPL